MKTVNSTEHNAMKTTCPAASPATSTHNYQTGAVVGPTRSVSEASDDLRHLHHRLIMDLDEERQYWRNELFKEHERLERLKALCSADVLAKYNEAEQALRVFAEEAGGARSKYCQ